MNLGLLSGLHNGYDFVVLLNSDVLVPENLARTLTEATTLDPRISSVTAWSNNVSIWSLPNSNTEANLRNPNTVTWISSVLDNTFKGRAVELPSAVGFCMMIRASAIRDVGLFDPIFGRGYCEEIDWSLRARRLGYRNVLAPSAFVYHSGSGSTRIAGVLDAGEATVPANEAIIDARYSDFRSQVQRFGQSEELEQMAKQACRELILSAAREWGYCVNATWLERKGSQSPQVQFTVDPEGKVPRIRAAYLGFKDEIDLDGGAVLGRLETVIGRTASKVGIFDSGRLAETLGKEARQRKVELLDRRPYPELVLAEQQ